MLMAFVGAAAALAIAPGPDILYVLSQSLANGYKAGLSNVAGLMTGCVFHTLLVAFLFSSGYSTMPAIIQMVKLAGGSYLLYLAYKVYQAPATLDIPEAGQGGAKAWTLYRQGVLMNLLNPKVALFFLAFFPGFLFSDQIPVSAQFIVLGMIFILVAFTVFSAVALMAGGLSELILKRSALGWYMKWFQIVVFLLLALYMFLG